jgi:hypothetical protein
MTRRCSLNAQVHTVHSTGQVRRELQDGAQQRKQQLQGFQGALDGVEGGAAQAAGGGEPAGGDEGVEGNKKRRRRGQWGNK